jgi:hypothetical protein
MKKESATKQTCLVGDAVSATPVFTFTMIGVIKASVCVSPKNAEDLVERCAVFQPRALPKVLK